MAAAPTASDLRNLEAVIWNLSCTVVDPDACVASRLRRSVSHQGSPLSQLDRTFLFAPDRPASHWATLARPQVIARRAGEG
jgi:hypothetical protein